MKKIIQLLFLVILLCGNVYGQEVFKEENYGFSIVKPKDWILGSNKALMNNLQKMKVDEKILAELIKTNQGSLLLASFYKYDMKTHAGLIPTIQINVRNNPTKTFEQFNIAMKQSSSSFKNYFNDFEFIKEPNVIDINGNKAVYFIGKYTLKNQHNEPMKVRSRTYAIPYGAYFFQVNFTDEQGVEDDTKLFDFLLNSIKIGK